MEEIKEVNTPEDDEIVVDFRILMSDLWRGFVKFWWIGAVLILLLGGLQFYRSYVRYTPLYQATATYTVQTVSGGMDKDSGVESYSFYYNKGTADQLEKVFPYIVSSNILQDQVCMDLQLPYMPASVSASVLPGSNMITLTTRGRDPQQTYDVLLSVVDNYDSVAEYIIGRTKLVSITNPVVPAAPYNQFAWRGSVMKGVLLGALLGMAWIVVYAVMRRTIRTKEDIHNELKQHCLGILPMVTFKKHRTQIDMTIRLDNPMIGENFMESLRLLKTAVQNRMYGGKKVLMVTSTAPAEGKSVTSVNLAALYAGSNSKVLLIDGDLRNSGIQRLIHEDEFEQTEEVQGKYVIAHGKKLDFDLLTFTEAKTNARRILRKNYMQSVLDSVRDKYDMILIDTPPCGIISDAVMVAELADCVLYVVRQDTILKTSICNSINALRSNGANIIGCVLTGATGGLGGYGSKYGYGGYYKSYYYGKSYRYGYGYGYGHEHKHRHHSKT